MINSEAGRISDPLMFGLRNRIDVALSKLLQIENEAERRELIAGILLDIHVLLEATISSFFRALFISSDNLPSATIGDKFWLEQLDKADMVSQIIMFVGFGLKEIDSEEEEQTLKRHNDTLGRLISNRNGRTLLIHGHGYYTFSQGASTIQSKAIDVKNLKECSDTFDAVMGAMSFYLKNANIRCNIYEKNQITIKYLGYRIASVDERLQSIK